MSSAPSSSPSLATLHRLYVKEARPLPRALEAALRVDPRVGVARILRVIDRRRQAARAEGQRLRLVTRYEEARWRQGVELVAGVDEAGMSPLAGPVVAGAVILPVGYRRAGVDDSKRLSAAQRDELVVHIKREAVSWGVGVVTPEEIDRINIYHAGLLAMRRAVEALTPRPEHLLVDARRVALPIPQQRIIKGDQKSISIAAASIVAKTTRDALMVELEARYPGYGFAHHKGYPVKFHLDALARLGPCPVHRRSFGPVRDATPASRICSQPAR